MSATIDSPYGPWVAVTKSAAKLAAVASGVPGVGEAVDLVFALAGISDAQTELLGSIKKDTELLRGEPFKTGGTLLSEARRVGPSHPQYKQFLGGAQDSFYRAYSLAAGPEERAVVAFNLTTLFLALGRSADALHWYAQSRQACREAVADVVRGAVFDLGGNLKIFDERETERSRRDELLRTFVRGTSFMHVWTALPTLVSDQRTRARVEGARNLIAFANAVEQVVATIRSESPPVSLQLVKASGGYALRAHR